MLLRVPFPSTAIKQKQKQQQQQQQEQEQQPHQRKPSLLILHEGGGDDLSATLNILRNGANLFKELGTHQVDEDEAETELQIEQQLKEQDDQARQQEQQEQEEKLKGEAWTEEETAATQQKSSPMDFFQPNHQSSLEETLEDSITTNTTNSTDSNTSTAAKNTTSDAVKELISKQLQDRLDAFDKRAKRTRIILLKKVASWAFDVVCSTNNNNDNDNDNDNSKESNGDDTTTTKKKKKKKKPSNNIDRNAFYSGILLVHLHLAKYVGVAACHPPTRDQIDELFELADQDRSGYLDEQEFTNAVVVACAPISSRIAVYWSLLAVLPVLVSSTMGGLAHLMRSHIHKLPASVYQKALSVLEFSIEHVLSLLFFTLLVPNIFGRIDKQARRIARERSQLRAKASSASTSTTLWWLRVLPQQQPPQPPQQSAKAKKDVDDREPPWLTQFSDWVSSGMTHRWSSSASDNEDDDDDATSESKGWNGWGFLGGTRSSKRSKKAHST